MCPLSLAALACDDDKPYTPFQVATSLPTQENAPKPETSTEGDEGKETKWATALRAPPGSASWKALNRTFAAPRGTEIQVALPILNSESDEVAAWVLPKGGKSVPNAEPGVWIFDATGAPARKLFDLPAYLPRGEDCQHKADLEGTGNQTLSARVSVTCSSRLLPGTPTFSLAVLEPTRPEPEVLHFRAEPPSIGERLDYQIDSHDHDGDGTDDIKLTVELVAPSGTKEGLPFIWLSRTAGASRAPDSPRVELGKRATRLTIASVRKAERVSAPAEVDALRRLLSAVCAELGKPRLTRDSGEALKCGDIQGALEQLAEVEIKARLGEKQLEEALGAFERATWFGRAFDTKKKKDLEGIVLGAIPHREAKRSARFNVATKSLPQPYASPLFFTDDGQLFALGTDKTKRLTMEGDPPLVVPASDDEPEKRLEPPEWSLELVDSKGLKVRAALPSCDRSEVLLALDADASGKMPEPTPLPLLAARPGSCQGFAPAPLSAVPLAADGGNLTVVVGGQRVTQRGAVRTPSAPVAWGTSLGVALLEAGGLSLLTGPDAAELHHCVVDKKSKEVACLAKGFVAVLEGPK